MRKNITTLAIALLLPGLIFAQEKFTREVAKFEKIVASPHINLVLTYGAQESVTIEYFNVREDELNVEVKGSTLQLYLDESRIIPKSEKDVNYDYRYDVYKNAEITAYVTFRHLSSLEVRGDQEVIVKSPVDAVQFKLKAYGANRIDMASMDAEVLKVVSYGENEITIRAGKVSEQKYALYGTSHVDVSNMQSSYSKAKVYGESELMLHASDDLDISAFGEPTITFYGNPDVHKNIIIGEARLFRVD